MFVSVRHLLTFRLLGIYRSCEDDLNPSLLDVPNGPLNIHWSRFFTRELSFFTHLWSSDAVPEEGVESCSKCSVHDCLNKLLGPLKVALSFRVWLPFSVHCLRGYTFRSRGLCVVVSVHEEPQVTRKRCSVNLKTSNERRCQIQVKR